MRIEKYYHQNTQYMNMMQTKELILNHEMLRNFKTCIYIIKNKRSCCRKKLKQKIIPEIATSKYMQQFFLVMYIT